jgi:hypothetical protein
MPDWTLNLTSDQAANFLRSLVEDDAFRSRLESSPEQAFAEKGIPVPPEAIEGPVKVPPKEALLVTFGAAFPDWQRRHSLISRLIAYLKGKPPPTPPPFGSWCKCWALAYLAASRVEKPPGA